MSYQVLARKWRPRRFADLVGQEHVVRALPSLVSRLTCLYGGQFVGDGDPASVLANPRVREIYLGVEVTAEQLEAEAGDELAGASGTSEAAGASGVAESDGSGT